MGLSAQEMGRAVVLEQVIPVALGTLCGSLLGVLISRLFIPFMQTGGSLAGSIPAFEVQIAWNYLTLIYGAVGLALLLSLGIMLFILRRLKAFEVIKLGMV